jgi:hypothetical protein
MPARPLGFRGDARARVRRGASALADAVRITLGPRSRSVLICAAPDGVDIRDAAVPAAVVETLA